MGPEPSNDALSATLDAVCGIDPRRILARLIRLLDDCDLAEEVLHDGFRAAGADADWVRPRGTERRDGGADTRNANPRAVGCHGLETAHAAVLPSAATGLAGGA